jgi:hypothetical protein
MIKALACSERIVERLMGPPQRGLVHSAFSSAANLLFAGDFLISLNTSSPTLHQPALTTSPDPAPAPLSSCEEVSPVPGDLLMPNGLLLSAPAGAWPFSHLKAGMPVILGAGWLVLETLACSLECAACQRWHPRVQRPPELDLPLLTANARRLAHFCRQHWQASSFSLPVHKHGTDILTLAAQICGRGPGLTPSGDDFLAGWLAAGWLLYGPAPAFLEVGQKIIALARQRTHLLSQCWLSYAAAGDIASPVHQLFSALCSPDERLLQPATRAVLALGATSGHDLIHGILYAIDQYPSL